MPNFRTLTEAEIAELTARRPRVEALDEYLEYLETLKPGDWGAIELAPGEAQRTVKRRTSTAAKNQGKRIKWRRSSKPDELTFEVLSGS